MSVKENKFQKDLDHALTDAIHWNVYLIDFLEVIKSAYENKGREKDREFFRDQMKKAVEAMNIELQKEITPETYNQFLEAKLAEFEKGEKPSPEAELTKLAELNVNTLKKVLEVTGKTDFSVTSVLSNQLNQLNIKSKKIVEAEGYLEKAMEILKEQ